MAEFKDWDDREYWEDDSKCLVCRGNMGKTTFLLCSVTCEDIFDRVGRQQGDLQDDRENDCYA